MGLYNKLLIDFEQLFLGYETLAIIPQSCLGGAAAALILLNGGHGPWEFVQLFLVVAVCMWYNTTVLANMKPKFIFNSLLVSLVTSTVLLVINVLEVMS